MNEVELEKHEKYVENVNCLKRRQYYLEMINNGKIKNISNNSTMTQMALAHDYLESDFRDKLIDIEEQIKNGSLGSLKVSFSFSF
jgi:hypothetical protein